MLPLFRAVVNIIKVELVNMGSHVVLGVEYCSFESRSHVLSTRDIREFEV